MKFQISGNQYCTFLHCSTCPQGNKISLRWSSSKKTVGIAMLCHHWGGPKGMLSTSGCDGTPVSRFCSLSVNQSMDCIDGLGACATLSGARCIADVDVWQSEAALVVTSCCVTNSSAILCLRTAFSSHNASHSFFKDVSLAVMALYLSDSSENLD